MTYARLILKTAFHNSIHQIILDNIRTHVSVSGQRLVTNTTITQPMKRYTNSLLAGVAGLFLLSLTTPAFADDKVETITGQGTCAKCALHETAKCQTAIQVEKGGKT